MSNRGLIIQSANYFEKQSDIAMALDVSRQYVNQIFKQENLSSASFKHISICPVCGKKFMPQWDYRRNELHQYCSGKCKHMSTLKELTCETCGKTFFREEYRLRSTSPGRFCSNKCQGKWLGKNYGWRRKMKTQKPRNGKSVWLYQKTYNILKETAEARSAKMNQIANEAVERYLVDEAWRASGRK